MARFLILALLSLFATGHVAVSQETGATIEPIPDDLWHAMQGRSWHASLDSSQCALPEECACPPRTSLVLVSVPYLNFEGNRREGQLIVAKEVAESVAAIFEDIFASGQFPIASIEPINRFDGDDDASMTANNTSAFNCRLTTGGTRLSSHAFGTAIDINPVQNPYVKGTTTLPGNGRAFDEPSERSADRAGVLIDGDVATTAFAKRGWTWGGNWTSLKDYQHFSIDGR